MATGERDGVPWVAVEYCLFHPQGGGQPADRGWVDGHDIVPARDHDAGLVVARSAGDLPLPDFTVGQSVEVRIDLAARRTYAALHTAGHLIEAAGRAQGWTHAANTHFPGQARIEFTAARPDPRLDTPEGREETTEALRTYVDKAIAEDAPVTWEYDAEGRRIVHLAGLHSAPCGGPTCGASETLPISSCRR